MLNKLILVCLIVFSSQLIFGQNFATPKDSDFPQINKTGKTVSDFIPNGWKIIGEAKGDLNPDSIADTALVLQGTNPKFIHQNTGLGRPQLDINPRILIILFGTKDGFRLADKSHNIIATSFSPTMEDPFDSIQIKDRILEINQHTTITVGGWGISKYSYKFRFRGGAFRLIGADKSFQSAKTGENESRSYNFLTRKVKIENGNDKTERTFVIRRVHTFETYKNPFEWAIEADYYI